MAGEYTVVELIPFGGAYSEAFGINDYGQVVGRAAHMFAPSSACLWHSVFGYAPINLGAAWDAPANPIQLRSQAVRISANGKIVGWTEKGSPDVSHATLYGGSAVDLNSALGGLGSQAHDVSAPGLVVGVAGELALGMGSPFIYDQQTNVLTSIPDVSVGVAKAVNTAGQVAGVASDTINGGWFAYFYADGKTTFLTSKLGVADQARDINDSGQVVGEFSSQPFIYTPGTKAPEILAPFFGTATALNEAGQVVGYMFKGGEFHAWLYTEKKGVVMLDTLIPPGSGWTFRMAHDVNLHGQIVGVGEFHGKKRGFLLTPPRSKERDQLFEAAIDPIALVLTGKAYQIWAELHHPHVEREKMQQMLRSMTSEDRTAVLARATTLLEYASSLKALGADTTAFGLSKLHEALLSMTDEERSDVVARAKAVLEIGRAL